MDHAVKTPLAGAANAAQAALEAATDAFGRFDPARLDTDATAALTGAGYLSRAGELTDAGRDRIARMGPCFGQIAQGQTLVFTSGGRLRMGIVARTTARTVFVEGARGCLHRITAAHWWRSRVQATPIPAEHVRNLAYFYGRHV